MIFKTSYIPLFFVLLIVIVLAIFILIAQIENNSSAQQTEKYQGPVQEGYDEQLFRDTGVYQKIEEEDNGN
jgi:preprotein translocase subunit YajC